MNIKFHNKLEIEINGTRKYVCYNTLLDSVFEKIGKLEPYFTHFAIGNGKVKADPKTTRKLSSYVCSLEAQTSVIKCNPDDGVFYVKKTANFSSLDNQEIVFSEIGIASSGEQDPDIFNHILITDENGSVVDVVKGVGESLEVKLTIFLELESMSEGLLTSGDNNLIKMLLGETLEDHKIYAVRGMNVSENAKMERSGVRYAKKQEASISGQTLENGMFELTISALLGEGETREILLINSDEAVARLNVMNSLPHIEHQSETLTTGDFGSLIVAKDTALISSVQDLNGANQSGYVEVDYARNVGDYVTETFDGFSASTTRFVSMNGEIIAFVDSYGVHMFRCKGYGVEKIQSGAISVGGIEKICIVNNAVWIKRSVEPFVELFKIESGVCTKTSIFMENFHQSAYSYNFKEFCVTELLNGKYLVGVIDAETETGLALKFSETTNGYILEEILHPVVNPCDRVVAFASCEQGDAKLCFLSGRIASGKYIRALQFVDEVVHDEGYGSQTDAMLNGQILSIETRRGFFVYNFLPVPYVRYYNSSDMKRYSPLDYQTEEIGEMVSEYVCVSADLSYIVFKDVEGKFLIFSSAKEDTFELFDMEFLKEIGHENIVDIVVMKSIVLVFTNEKVICLGLDKRYKAVRNLENGTDYNVSYSTYDLLGSREYEGVRIDMKFLFSKEGIEE